MRSGHQAASSLTPEAMRSSLSSLIQGLISHDKLQEAFGYQCVDEGTVAGIHGTSIEEYLQIHAAIQVTSPLHDHLDELSDNELLTAVEVLHELVSDGVTGRHHDFCHCGWHYDTFSQEPAQILFRSTINKLLSRFGDKYILTDSGSIELLLDEPASSLVHKELPGDVGDEIEHRIHRAREIFLAPSSDWDNRRVAIRELGDILESLRTRVREHLGRPDEQALFEILNNFGIRHLNDRQKTDYDKKVFLKWIFHVCLASIHACLELNDHMTQNQE